MKNLSSFFLVLAYIFGLMVLGSSWPFNLIGLILGMLLMVLLYFELLFNKKVLAYLAILSFLLAFLTLTIHYGYSYARDPLLLYAQKKISLEGRLTNYRKADSGQVYLVLDKVKISSGESSRGKVELILNLNEALPLGTIIQLEGELEIPAQQRNPGGYSSKRTLLGQGIWARMYPKNTSLKILGSRTNLILLCREKMSRRIKTYVPSPYGELVCAILLGLRDDLPSLINQNFQRAGLSHLLAVSGLHVGFVLMIFWLILNSLPLKKFFRTCLFLVIIVFYIMLTGANPPVVRAGTLAILTLFPLTKNKDGSSLNNLAISGLLVLVFNPIQLWLPGFQLSYVVTAFILGGQKMINQFKGWLTKTLAISILATMVATPLTAFHFYSINPWNILTGLWAVPMAAGLIITGFLGFIPFLGPFIFYYISYPLASIFLALIELWGHLPGVVLEVFPPSSKDMFVIYLMIALLIYYFTPQDQRELKRNKNYLVTKVFLVLIGFLFFSSILEYCLDYKKSYCVFLDVGQGDAIHVKLAGGKNILVDGGGGKGDNGDWVGRQIVLPYLFTKKIKKIDGIFVSHFHADHYKGLMAVLEKIPVGFVAGPPLLGTPEEEEFLAHLKKINLNYQQLTRDYYWEDDFSTLQILHPGTGNYSPNNSSLVMKFNINGHTILLTGDIEKEAERELLRENDNIEANILKVPHHGSNTSSTLDFLEAVKPSLAIVSVGKNSYGHPAPELLERYKDLAVPIYLTKEEGAIKLELGKKIIRFRSFLQENKSGFLPAH